MRLMKRIYIYVSFIILISGCSPKTDFLVISKLIYKDDIRIKSQYLINKANNAQRARLYAFKLDTSNFLKGKLNDTTYVIELFNSESSSFYGAIHNKSKKMYYSYIGKQFKFDYSSGISDYQTNLILKWDTVTIRKKEAAFKTWLDNNTSYKVTRCIKKNDTFKLERIHFNDFLDPDYDKHN